MDGGKGETNGGGVPRGGELVWGGTIEGGRGGEQ